MKEKLLFFILFCTMLINPLYSQSMPEAVLSIRGIGTSFIQSSQGEGRIVLNQVDALGISPNPLGDVYYDEEKGGTFYSIGVEIVTEVNGASTVSGRLQVMRSPGLSGNQLPVDALYDSDYNVKFGPGADIHPLRELQPFVIRSDLSSVQTETQRKIGVFISKDLAPGRYEATVIYSLSIF